MYIYICVYSTHISRIRTTWTRMAWRSTSQLKEDSASLDCLQVSAGREPDELLRSLNENWNVHKFAWQDENKVSTVAHNSMFTTQTKHLWHSGGNYATAT